MSIESHNRMDRSLTDIQRITAVNKLTNSQLNTNELYVEGRLDMVIARKVFPDSTILIEGSKDNLIRFNLLGLIRSFKYYLKRVFLFINFVFTKSKLVRKL